MKILITITKGDIGGAQVSVLTLAKILKSKGYSVIVGMGEGDSLKNELAKINIPVHIFNSLKRSVNPLKNIMFIFEIKKYLDNNKIDIVHFNSSNSLLGAIGAKLSKYKPKTIFTFHGLSTLDPECGNFFTRIIYWIIFKFLLIFIDKNIFVSYDNLEKAKKIKLIKNGVVIYNAICEESLNFINKNQVLNWLETKTKCSLTNKFIIGSVGRLSKQKNYKFLIKNFPKLLKIEPNAICVIIGDGPEKSFLQKLIIKLNLKNKIYLLGGIEDAAKYIKIFDIFILPSLYEGLSISLIETIFAEIPALASNVGGNREVINKDFTYKLNDEVEFQKTFKIIHSNGMKQDFDKQKLLFSTSIMINELDKIYK